jgi:hypothetical protein
MFSESFYLYCCLDFLKAVEAKVFTLITCITRLQCHTYCHTAICIQIKINLITYIVIVIVVHCKARFSIITPMRLFFYCIGMHGTLNLFEAFDLNHLYFAVHDSSAGIYKHGPCIRLPWGLETNYQKGVATFFVILATSDGSSGN